MKTSQTARKFLLTAAMLTVLTGIGGCASSSPTSEETTTTIDGSRATFYGSVDEMAGDSTIVVTATVKSQREPKDGIAEVPGTISELEVGEVISADQDGNESAVAEGSTIFVFQYGTKKFAGPAALLQADGTYLLFLTSTGLPDAKTNEYFTTGGSAGIYQANATGYTSLIAEEDKGKDKIPKSIAKDELKKLIG